MKTQAAAISKLAAGLACLGLCGSAIQSLHAQELFPQVPSMDRPWIDNPKTTWGTDYTNWVEVGVGNFWVRESEAEFQRRHSMPDGLFGGIQDFHMEQRFGENDLLEVDGKAIFGSEDYALRLAYTRQNVGFVRGGFKQYRVWYDRHGGYLPEFGFWDEPYGREADLDRGEVWFETGIRMENVPEVTFRYSHQYRDGEKDSTIWGDMNVNRGLPPPAPAIRYNTVPAYRILDEERNIFALDARHRIGSTAFGAGLRYEHSEVENQLRFVRRPGEQPPLTTEAAASQRYLTQRDNVDTDLLNAHAFVEQRLSPVALFTSGYSFTTLDTDIGGNRIIGEGFEAVYDLSPGRVPFARRQPFDEGFLNLSGGGKVHQHTANLNLLLTPFENFSLLPGIRVSKETEEADSWFIETNVGFPPARAEIQESLRAENDNSWLDVTGALEARYSGITNVALYARGEWTVSDGEQNEYETLFTTNRIDEIIQEVEQERFVQKYTIGANWYPMRRLSLGLQYYHKIRESEYDPSSEMHSGMTNYPGLIWNQDFETDDVNARVTIRPLNNLTSVSRYDLQYSTIDTTAGLYGEIQSGKIISHIFSQSVSWAPVSRLYLQVSGSYAFDETETPIDHMPGELGTLVRDSLNSYFNASALAGFAIDDLTHVQLQYFLYLADNDIDQNVDSVPYNSSAEEHGITATLSRQLTSALRWTLKYGYYTSNDDLFGGNKDYSAHLLYSGVQMRF